MIDEKPEDLDLKEAARPLADAIASAQKKRKRRDGLGIKFPENAVPEAAETDAAPAAKRLSIPKKVRFEVFKRDSFKCQYCGHAAPDVVLVVDHLHPVALGGTNEILNLVTACVGCNAGKGASPLSDNSAINRQRAQLEELQERREQMDLLYQWQKSLIDLDANMSVIIERLWRDVAPGSHLTTHGADAFRKAAKKYGLNVVCTAMRDASAEHLVIDEASGFATEQSRNKIYDLALKIAKFRHQNADKPHMRDVMYIRACVKNNYGLQNGRELAEATNLIEGLVLAGYSRMQLKAMMYEHNAFWKWHQDAKAILGLP